MKTKERYRELVLLIYDEFGMARKFELAKGLHMLKKFVGRKNDEECRVHIIFTGDLSILTSSSAINYIFEAPSSSLKGRRKTLESSGYEEWLKIKKGNYFNGNMRQKDDSRYAELLSILRLGISGTNDLKLLNSRVMYQSTVENNSNTIEDQLKQLFSNSKM